MSDRLFDIEDVPEVPLFREPRRSRGAAISDERLSHDYPPEWDRCTTCGGDGKQSRWESFEFDGATRQTGGAQDGLWRLDAPCPDCLGMGSLKARVRLEAGHRCVRCGHPYMPKGDAKMLGVEPSGVGGEHMGGRWSACDEKCTHGGPLRMVGYPTPDGLARPPEPAPYVERSGAVVAGVEVAAGYALEAEWRILTVHHLDGDKANLAWWNLAALCQRDHLYIQSKVVMDRVYPHEHSAWFKPHVAAYYAKVYLGDDLTREQTLERLDELLALELVA